jgi:hypothetical protein
MLLLQQIPEYVFAWLGGYAEKCWLAFDVIV